LDLGGGAGGAGGVVMEDRWWVVRGVDGGMAIYEI